MIHFYLRQPRKDGNCNIVLTVTIQRTRLVYNSGILAKPSEWDSKVQRIKNKSRSLEVNGKLQQLAAFASKFADELPLGEQPLQGKFSEFMDIQLGKRKVETVTFFTLFQKFCDQGAERINKHTGELITDTRKRRFYNTLNILRKFEQFQRQRNQYFKLTVDSFTTKVVSDFKIYMINVLEFAPGTINHYLKILKMFLMSEGNNTVDYSQMKVGEDKVENIILTEGEIDQIIALDLSDNLRLNNCRNMFLIQLHTGLRFSDVSRLNETNVFIEEEVIRLHTQKTGQEVEIPIHPRIKEIFANGNYCHPISNARYNQYLKELGELAKIDTLVEIKKTKAGKRVIFKEPKWKFITSHTGRRTFCSLLYMKGVDCRLIMNFSGHHSVSAFERYICLDSRQKNELLKKYW